MKRKPAVEQVIFIIVLLLAFVALALVFVLPKGSMEVNPIYQQF